MLKKMLGFTLLGMMILALFLAIAGVQKIELDNTYYSFMKTVTNNLSTWSFEIPKIPMIPYQSTASGFDLLKVLVDFVNGLSSFVNVIIMLINIIIGLIQFILTLVYTIIDFVGSVPTTSSDA